MITGDLTSEDILIAARKKAIDYFKDNYKVSEDQVLKAIGVRTVGQVRAEQIADLRGLEQSLKDGDTTPDEAFGLSFDKSEPVTARKVEAPANEPANEPVNQKLNLK